MTIMSWDIITLVDIHAERINMKFKNNFQIVVKISERVNPSYGKYFLKNVIVIQKIEFSIHHCYNRHSH